MGWVSLANTTPDTFISRRLENGGAIIGMSLTIQVNPADIFVAQISLSSVIRPGIYAYISGITLQNGDFIDLSRSQLSDVEWAWARSVTFVLTRVDPLNQNAGRGRALATVTTYRS